MKYLLVLILAVILFNASFTLRTSAKNERRKIIAKSGDATSGNAKAKGGDATSGNAKSGDVTVN